MSRGPKDIALRLAQRARLPEALVRFSIARPVATLAIWLVIVVALLPGFFSLRIETTTDSLLDQSGSRWEFYQESQRIFGGDEILAVMLRSETPYDPALLEKIITLSDRFARLPGVRRVDSLATVPLVEATPDFDLSLEPALARGVPQSQTALLDLARRLEKDRIAPNALVSHDGRAFALNLILEHAELSNYDVIFAGIEAAQSEWPLVYSGVPVFRQQASVRTSSELMTFVPISVAVVGLLLVVIFRSMRAAAIALGVSGIGVLLTLSTMGFLGTRLSMSTAILPPVLLALGSAYCMHFLASAAGQRGRKMLEETLLPVALPVALSGLTTAIGFLSVSFVQIQAVRDVSVFGAIGVVGLVAASLTAAPAGLSLMPLPNPQHRFDGVLGPAAPGRLVAFVRRKSRALVLSWLALLGLAVFGISQLQVETDAVLLFRESDPIRVAYREVSASLSGISPMNVVIEAPPGRSISEPGLLRRVDALAHHLESLTDVGKVLSYADLVRQLHTGFNPELAGVLPEDEAAIEQYLLLLESKDYFFDLVTPDHTRANMLLRVDNNGSGALLDVAREAEAWWAENGDDAFRVQTTGIMFEFARSEDRISEGQLRGLFFALAAIGIILLAFFGQPRLAMLALIPNALPVGVVFGAMGIFDIPLDAGTVFVGSLALGIAVDDSIHELSEFHRRRASGDGIDDAIEGAFRRVLRPLVFTTIVVACGFAVLGVSNFTYTRNLGLLTAGVMVLCLLADLILLPLILQRWAGDSTRSSPA